MGGGLVSSISAQYCAPSARDGIHSQPQFSIDKPEIEVAHGCAWKVTYIEASVGLWCLMMFRVWGAGGWTRGTGVPGGVVSESGG